MITIKKIRIMNAYHKTYKNIKNYKNLFHLIKNTFNSLECSKLLYTFVSYLFFNFLTRFYIYEN